MSLYDLTRYISRLAETKYIKTYDDDYVVAIFYKNNKKIKLYYSEYNKSLLKQKMENDYERIVIDMDFWDPEFCSKHNIMEKDIDIVIKHLQLTDRKDNLEITVGYLLSLITLHKIIYKSYKVDDYVINDNVDFDKNIMMKLFCDFDMVINFNDKLINFINNVFDEDNMVKFAFTLSGKFRFIESDIKYFLENTKRVHEISTYIVKSETDVGKILNYHLELLKVCGDIYSPDIITSYRAENILLNLLKLDINLDIHEMFLFKIIGFYIDKKGSLDITFDFDNNSNIISLLDSIREYHLSSYQGNF